MTLSASFIKALCPVLIAGAQSFSPATPPPESFIAETPAIVQIAPNIHSQPSARLSFGEWKKRLHEARSGVTVATYQAQSLNQPAPAAPI